MSNCWVVTADLAGGANARVVQPFFSQLDQDDWQPVVRESEYAPVAQWRRRVSLIDQAWAQKFAKEWIAAWNSHDLDRILSHYVEDFEMSSPIIIERKIDPSGVLRGKAAIREYWAIGLAAVPRIQFELIDVHVGVNSVGILYRSIGRRRVIEMLTFNEEREVVRGAGLYGGPA